MPMVPPAVISKSQPSCNAGTCFRTRLLLFIEDCRPGKGIEEDRRVSIVCFARSGDASPTMSFKDGVRLNSDPGQTQVDRDPTHI